MSSINNYSKDIGHGGFEIHNIDGEQYLYNKEGKFYVNYKL